jgi:membrane protein YdbS with pleckstrin-like domain
MSYIDRELGNNETMILEERVSRWILFPRLLSFSIAVLVLCPLAVALGDVNGVATAFAVFLLLLLIFLVSAFKPLRELLTTEVAITDQRVISKKGWLSTAVISTPLDKVNNINVRQSFFGNMFNYGNIEITTATTLDTDNHLISALNRPDNFRNVLSEEIEKQRLAGGGNKSVGV